MGQLLRIVARENEVEELSRMDAARVATGFSAAEAGEFRQIFYDWYKRSSEPTADTQRKPESDAIRTVATEKPSGNNDATRMGRRRSMPMPSIERKMSMPTVEVLPAPIVELREKVADEQDTEAKFQRMLSITPQQLDFVAL